MRLKDKIAIVTGGGVENGIGRAIVRAFAKEGADVCIADINDSLAKEAAEEVEKAGQRALAIKCDISKLKDIDHTVNAVLEEWKRIDILVNNAGIARFKPFLQVSPELTRKIWSVNLFGTFFMSQRVARHMVKRAKSIGYKPGDPATGKIINLSSLSEEVGTPLLSHYSTTKGGIKIMTKCMALELAEYGIRVNAIGPGIVDTSIATDFFAIKENYDAATERIPLKYHATGKDIAGAAVFLASSESDYITGTTIMVDGGLTAQ
nr:SDR family oxidoreductase [Desulfobacterales bacterium]